MGLRTQTANGLFSLLSLLFCITSLSVFIITNALFAGWTDQQRLVVTPFRWVAATLVPILIASSNISKKSLSTCGALLALLAGFVLILANYIFFLSLLAFFISSSRAIRFKAELKTSYTESYSRGAHMGLLQVLCSCGVAVHLCVLYLLDIGPADLPIDFRHQYRASWFGCAVLGSLSCSCGDTWASQLGSVLSPASPRLITSLRPVPRVGHTAMFTADLSLLQGTNGGVSLPGLIFSFLGGLVVGAAYYLGVILFSSSQDLILAPSQLNVILLGGLGGLLGSVIDSFLGASLQFSGKDTISGQIVEVSAEGVIPISGKMVLDNNSVNLISNILTAVLLPELAINFGL